MLVPIGKLLLTSPIGCSACLLYWQALQKQKSDGGTQNTRQCTNQRNKQIYNRSRHSAVSKGKQITNRQQPTQISQLLPLPFLLHFHFRFFLPLCGLVLPSSPLYFLCSLSSYLPLPLLVQSLSAIFSHLFVLDGDKESNICHIPRYCQPQWYCPCVHPDILLMCSMSATVI